MPPLGIQAHVTELDKYTFGEGQYIRSYNILYLSDVGNKACGMLLVHNNIFFKTLEEGNTKIWIHDHKI